MRSHSCAQFALASLFFFLVVQTAFAQKIKVDVVTTQEDLFVSNVRTTTSTFETQYTVQLTNTAGKAQNLKYINVNFTPAQLIPEGIPYMIGADEMQNLDGHMDQLVTGKSYKNDYSNMYLLFRRSNDYLLVGVSSWRTFLCKISTKNGLVTIQGQGDNKEVKAAETIPFEKIVVLHDKSWQNILDRYADVLVKENNVKKPKQVLWKGWSTWDFYAQKFSSTDIYENMAALKATGANTNMIQIDGGWWKFRGDFYDVRDNIEDGIKGVIEKIHAAGYKAGLHFDGFRAASGAKIAKAHPEYFLHTLSGELFTSGRDAITKDPLLIWDYSHPGAREYIREVMRNSRKNWKVDYFKIDFMQQGLYSGVSYLPVTNVERLRMGLKAMKEGWGDDAYFLACSSNFGTVVGLADGNRMGGDINPDYKSVRQRAKHTSGSYYLGGKVYNLDPDYEVLRSESESNNRDLKKPTLTYDEAVMWNTYIALYGNARFNCDNIMLLSDEKKKLIPALFNMPLFVKMVPLDLWDHYKTDTDAPCFYMAKTKEGKIWIGLFNWDDKAATFTVSGFKQIGILKTVDEKNEVKISNGKMITRLKSVHSTLFEYRGSESFDALRQRLTLNVSPE